MVARPSAAVLASACTAPFRPQKSLFLQTYCSLLSLFPKCRMLFWDEDEAMSYHVSDRYSPVRVILPAIACIAALAIAGVTSAQAKQVCSVAAGSQGYWSWRMIDGKKCWYAGKPMLSKSMLEWPAEASAQPVSEADATAAPVMRRSDPMDAQASIGENSPTFEQLWRSRIGNK